MQIIKLAIIASLLSPFLAAQEDAALAAAAKALDQESLKLRDLPAEARLYAIHDVAARIRRQPAAYIAALASNLSIDVSEADGLEALQDVADTVVEAIHRAPADEFLGHLYSNLAYLVRYGHVQVSLQDPKYVAALAELVDKDRQLSAATFALQDIDGRTWELKKLRGKVVLVNFWGTFCPPCRAEMPDLEGLYRRFRGQGLVILAISGEEPAVLRKYLATNRLTFPLLLDPDGTVKKQFHVTGFPKTFLYDRQGHLAGQTLDQPNSEGWIRLLSSAGLR